MRSTMIAAAALAMAATQPAVAADIGYAIPTKWAPSLRSGNNKSRSKMDRERARSKAAQKSRRQQRKAAKR